MNDAPGTGPLISVVTPVRNGSRFLERLIQSVREQRYRLIEFVVIDDGSDDSGTTIEILKRHPEIKWWSRPNRGLFATLNEGILAARGDWVLLIAADDFIVDEMAIGDLVADILAHPECQVAHGLTLHVDSDGKPLDDQPYQEFPYWMLRHVTFISHCSLLVRRQKLLEDGLLFDPTLRYVGDADWLARLYLAGYRFSRVQRLVGAFRHHEEQTSELMVRDPDRARARRAEGRLFEERYGGGLPERWLAHGYVGLARRLKKVSTAYRRKGVGGVLRMVRQWIARW